MTTKDPGRQRLRLHNLPLHQRHKQLSAHLSDELLQRYERRALPVRVGDTVRVMRGDSAGTTGKVLAVDHKSFTMHIEGVTVRRARGQEIPRPIHPSNVVITKLNLQDRRRRERLAVKGVAVEAPEPEPKPAKPAKAAPAAAAAAAPKEAEEE